MIGVNKVILVGNVGRIPDVVSFPSEGSMPVKKASFPLATTEYRRNRDNERVEIEAAYFAAKESLRNSDMSPENRRAAELALAIGGTAYRIAMNTADTRSWEILPKEFLLTQFPMPQNRTLTMQLTGQVQQNLAVDIPADSRSAIVYINAPSPYNVSCQVLPIKSK